MLASVGAQAFGDWEHCLVDDGSTAPHVRAVLDEAAVAEPRLQVGHRVANGGIVAASNEALALATGEFVVLLDHDDELHPDALRRADEALAATPEADYLYTDEDRIDEAGRHSSPFFKPDWSPERLRTQMYTAHMSVLRTALVREVGGFHEGFDGAQDWDLVFRVTERARTVVHVPEVLYHWRTLPGSTAGEGAGAKPWAYDAATRAIQAHCDRTGVRAVASRDATYDGVYHLTPRRGGPARSGRTSSDWSRRPSRASSSGPRTRPTRSSWSSTAWSRRTASWSTSCGRSPATGWPSSRSPGRSTSRRSATSACWPAGVSTSSCSTTTSRSSRPPGSSGWSCTPGCRAWARWAPSCSSATAVSSTSASPSAARCPPTCTGVTPATTRATSARPSWPATTWPSRAPAC